jgi:hypothetical protein
MTFPPEIASALAVNMRMLLKAIASTVLLIEFIDAPS